MIILNIIWPAFAMVALTFAVWFTLVWQRMAHTKRTPPTAETFANNAQSSRYFEPVERPASNLANLFEMPVLFFALIPLLVIAQQATPAQVVLAWGYVALRAAHSVVHVGPNTVRPRFFLYLASCAVLVAMWLGFFIDMVAAAAQYRDAVQAMGHP